MNNYKPKIASMFAGIGGICSGFIQAGCDVVWANEINAAACRTYCHNFGGNYLFESDIKKVEIDTIPDFDILTAGFPSIIVSVHFLSDNNLFNDESTSLDYISIEDNGVGFTAENLARFKELASNTKGLNNRGTGKIQIFCKFNNVEISSTFYENEKWNDLSVI
jgi:hypothetical protein